MSTVDNSRLVWRKSSRSNHDDKTVEDCVEVAFAVEAVAVRDSKSRSSDMLMVPALAWDKFVTNL